MNKIIAHVSRFTHFNDPLKMVIAVRTDLKMGKGKIAAQVGHGVLTVGMESLQKQPEIMQEYFIGQQKVCVKVSSEDELVKIHNQAKTAGILAVA